MGMKLLKKELYKMSKIHIFVMDNIDSFIFNLVDFLHTVTPNISIYRNTANADTIMHAMEQSEKAGNKPIVLLSPGPKSPSDVPSMDALINLTKGKFPIVGICLGHQALVENYGGVVGRCEKIMHGKKSLCTLSNHPVFKGLGDSMSVARYHSLTALEMPEGLTIIAHTEDAIMGIADDKNKVIGYQFHPESILTVAGEKLLQNTFKYVAGEDLC